MPVFEIATGQPIPSNKFELRSLVSSGVANWFRVNFCKLCHMIPEPVNWLSNVDEAEMKIVSKTKRNGKLRLWESIYIGTNAEPWWDERLDFEGKSNKMQQAYTMCMLDYDFNVLSNAFLVHKPGIESLDSEKEREREELRQRTNTLMREVILPELNILFGEREGCEMKNELFPSSKTVPSIQDFFNI